MKVHFCLPGTQVAALPPPDEAEMAALEQELLALEAVMTDFQRLLHAEGYSLETADDAIQIAQAAAASATHPLSAVSPRAAVMTAQSQPGDSAKQQVQLPEGHARGAQALLCNTDNSLSAIDAMMQARGYR